MVGHREWVRMVRVSPDGLLVASCSNDQSVRIWNIASGDCKIELDDHDHVVECVAWGPEAASTYISDTSSGSGDVRCLLYLFPVLLDSRE